MKFRLYTAILLGGLFVYPVGLTFAADQDRDQMRDQAKDREMIYGYELMTVEERAAHRKKMQSFNTEEEREAYRQEHHKQMQARAKERGVELPDVPRKRGTGQGFGMRSGGGTGSGSGGGKNR